MAIDYGLGDMNMDANAIEKIIQSIDELKASLTKLTEDLEAHSWNSDGGRKMGERIKAYANGELREHIEFLEGKAKDLAKVIAVTDEMHRA